MLSGVIYRRIPGACAGIPSIFYVLLSRLDVMVRRNRTFRYRETADGIIFHPPRVVYSLIAKCKALIIIIIIHISKFFFDTTEV